ncbi:hypothetical protein ACQEWB_48025 [Streptomyces sp. CA-249302]
MRLYSEKIAKELALKRRRKEADGTDDSTGNDAAAATDPDPAPDRAG